MTLLFEPVEGSHLSSKQAQKYGEVLFALEERHQGITAELILDQATSKLSPLHDWFEWNNKKAAHEYRLEQARVLVRSIAITVQYPDGDRQIRAFHIVKNGETSYRSITKIQSEEIYRQQIIANAFKELEGWRKRYKDYNELKEAVDLVDKILTIPEMSRSVEL